MELVDVTIIGGGPCGLFAAFYAGLREMSVRIIDSLPEMGGQLTALYPEKVIYDMPGFPEVLAKDLAAKLVKQGTQFNPETVLGVTAVRLEAVEGGYLIEGSDGEIYPTRTVIVAAGAGAFSPTRIGIPREEELEGKGVHYGVRDKSVFKDRSIAIVGGGDSAFDWCLNLLDTAGDIYLVHRRDVFRAHESSEKAVKDSRVQMKLWKKVQELHGDKELEGVTLLDTKTQEPEFLGVDAVIVNIGFKSSLGPIRDWGFELDKAAIMVNGHNETSLPGVFAIGDVCSYGKKLKLIATGVGEAATAVCYAKTLLDPSAKLFPGHSSDRSSVPASPPSIL